MFDLAESALLGAMSAAQRDERVACARRMLLAGRLCQRRMADVETADRTQWCVDNWEAVAAEVGAELGISRGRASAQMNYGLELLERLPRLGAVFAAGTVDLRVIIAAVFRSGLITDPALLARIDTVLARGAPHWNRLSPKRLTQIIDHWVTEVDPAARRTAPPTGQDRTAMARITVEDCLDKIPNRFQLVLAATYRARMLSQGHAPKIETKNKPGVTALREIAAGEIGLEMLRKVPV